MLAFAAALLRTKRPVFRPSLQSLYDINSSKIKTAQTTNGMYLLAPLVIQKHELCYAKNVVPQNIAGCCCIAQCQSKSVGISNSKTQRFRVADKNLQCKLNDKAEVAENVHVICAFLRIRHQYDQ